MKIWTDYLTGALIHARNKDQRSTAANVIVYCHQNNNCREVPRGIVPHLSFPPLLPCLSLRLWRSLFQVTAAPTYEEMLAWAEETDERISAGRLPPLGSREPPPAAGAAGTAGAAGGSLLSEQEQAQVRRRTYARVWVGGWTAGRTFSGSC